MTIQDIGKIKPLPSSGDYAPMFNLNNILAPIGRGTVILFEDLNGVKYIANLFARVALDPESDKDSFLLTDDFKRQEILNSEMLGGEQHE